MLTTTRSVKIFLTSGKVEDIKDELVREFRLHIRLDGKEYAEAVLSCSLLEEFVLGFLFTRGLIKNTDDILSLDIADNVASIKRKQFAGEYLQPVTLIESTGSSNIDTGQFSGPDSIFQESDFTITPEILFQGVDLLSEMPLYRRTGASHCAILLSSEGDRLVSADDIGRHNTVDKCIGGGLKKGVDFGKCWIAVSGRLPSDMVYKAAIAGMPLVASVSAATSDGVKMAEKAGITLVGFTRGNKFSCYCHSERIV